jgi:hypothetical protein
MRCKFRLEKLTKTMSGYEVTFLPVVGGSRENDSFFKYTPYGEMKVGLVNETVAEKLEVGREYYLDLSVAL